MSKSPWSSGKQPAKRTNVSSASTGSDAITTSLQALFAPLAAEPIPDDFTALLDRIDAKSQGTDAESPDSQQSAGAAK